MLTKEQKKLTLIPLILMVFTSVFGFANVPRSYYMMGYGAIFWYLISAITFFVPYALMMTEFGTAFKDDEGGIYTWVRRSVGPRFAIVTVFMWYTSYIIWMVNVSNTLLVSVSNMLFGHDTTQEWSIFGLQSSQVLASIAILWIIFVTFVGSKGLKQITRVTSIGGVAVMFLNVALIIGSIIVLIYNGGQLSEPINGISTFYANSPNIKWDTTISVLGFVVFALFSYGGLEAIGGLSEKTEKPEKTFPKGIMISAIVVCVGYSLSLFLCGIFTNWARDLSGSDTHLGNVLYVMMGNLGYQVGTAFGMSSDSALALGSGFCNFIGLSMFLAYCGAFFILSYSPLKMLVFGTPDGLWPKKMKETKNGMPVFAMWIQCAIVVAFLALLILGGSAMSDFFEKLTFMTTVAMTLPPLLLAFAYIRFKRDDTINKPFIAIKTKGLSLIAGISVMITVGFGNFFTIIEPLFDNDISSFLWIIAGPVIFSLIALTLYHFRGRQSEDTKSSQ